MRFFVSIVLLYMFSGLLCADQVISDTLVVSEKVIEFKGDKIQLKDGSEFALASVREISFSIDLPKASVILTETVKKRLESLKMRGLQGGHRHPDSAVINIKNQLTILRQVAKGTEIDQLEIQYINRSKAATILELKYESGVNMQYVNHIYALSPDGKLLIVPSNEFTILRDSENLPTGRILRVSMPEFIAGTIVEVSTSKRYLLMCCSSF